MRYLVGYILHQRWIPSNLGVMQSRTAALFGFRACIFLDTNQGSNRKKFFVLVCHHYSLPFVYNWGFLKSLFSQLRRKRLAGSPFRRSRTASVLSSRFIAPICCLLFGSTALESTFQFTAVDFAEFFFSQKNLLFVRLRSRVIYYTSSLSSKTPAT